MQEHVATQPLQGLISYKKWLSDMGRDEVTGWRWRKLGWLDEPINIAGRLYISAEQRERFNRRAEAGEFAKEHKTPPPPVAA